MADERRLQADEQAPDDYDGLPVAAGLVILMIGIVAAFLVYGLWLGAVQCIRVGGCG